MTIQDWPDHLPGGQLLREGVLDLYAGRVTPAACLAVIARGRLNQIGLTPPIEAEEIPEPEHCLYTLLRQEGGDAYSRYNSLLRELASFEQALDRRNAAVTGAQQLRISSRAGRPGFQTIS